MLIITCFTNYPRISLLVEWTHTFENPLPAKATIGTLDVWAKLDSENRALPRSVWQDLTAVQGRSHQVCLPSDNRPGREIVQPGVLRPNLVDYITYDMTGILHAKGDIALAFPADLDINSAALSYVLCECGKERVFSLRPQESKILTLPL